ncbi:MAG: DUF1223 domain-containing protein [Bryobacteraceae bacterium]|nr:DUF1223 domain-containing protein [Bryobacteraceae bacterium]
MDLTRRALMFGVPAALLASRTAENRVPVLVELFTSEGCSSCPPADELLIRLVKEQSVPGAEVIALGQHVDYWNRLGWADPFSAPTFTQRQKWYADGFQGSGSYTPQMVVDGQTEFVGSDSTRATRAIVQATKTPKLPADLALLDGTATFSIDASSWNGHADVVLAVVENNLQTTVKRGENGGRVLHHASVVRSWTPVGGLDGGSKFTLKKAVELRREWKAPDLRVVLFAQDSRSRRIVAVRSVSV